MWYSHLCSIIPSTISQECLNNKKELLGMIFSRLSVSLPGHSVQPSSLLCLESPRKCPRTPRAEVTEAVWSFCLPLWIRASSWPLTFAVSCSLKLAGDTARGSGNPEQTLLCDSGPTDLPCKTCQMVCMVQGRSEPGGPWDLGGGWPEETGRAGPGCKVGVQETDHVLCL